MNVQEFHFPKFKVEDGATSNYARIVAEPFERGYGTTVGNSLRRVLLASLEGSAVTAIRFASVPHEFSAIPGVYEDATDVVLNLKRCRIRLRGRDSLIFTFVHEGEGPVTAREVFAGQEIDVYNPALVVFTGVQPDVRVEMEIKVAHGRGYVPAEQFEFEHAPLGTIYLDAGFSPVTRVNFMIEDARVGQMTDFDRLILDVWTDGSMTPQQALRDSARLLIRHFEIFAVEDDVDASKQQDQTEEDELLRKFAAPVTELDLSSRAANCLKTNQILTIGDLVSRTEAEMLTLKNFGKGSLDELKGTLADAGLSFGMAVPGRSSGHAAPAGPLAAAAVQEAQDVPQVNIDGAAEEPTDEDN